MRCCTLTPCERLLFSISRRFSKPKPYSFSVVCPNPKCAQLYSLEDAVFRKTCNHVRFPDHRQRRFQTKECGAKLVTLKNGVWVPIKQYGCANLEEVLRVILNRSDVMETILSRPDHPSSDGVFSEVWDGTTWNTEPWKTYFQNRCNLGLQLNVDWYQPHKRTKHSTGVLFLWILNLPISMRYKCVEPSSPETCGAHFRS